MSSWFISAEMKSTFLPSLTCCTLYKSSRRTVVLPTPGAPAAMILEPGMKPPSLDKNLSTTVPVCIGVNRSSEKERSSSLVSLTLMGLAALLVGLAALR